MRVLGSHPPRIARLALLLAFAGACAALSAHDASALPGCGASGVVCSRVSVPLDWSGQRAGTVSLNVQVHRTSGNARGVMFLMAGGPGQASTRYIDIGRYGYWSKIFPGYTLVTFDPRGTGDSSPLRCSTPAHPTATASRAAAATATCAQQLGPDRAFFATSDNAMDVEAIRKELGYARIGLYGASYGTDVALAYARAFPDRVQRLVLDSVASPLTALPVLSEVLRRTAPTLSSFCARLCDGVTSDYGRDVVALANSLDTTPLRGSVAQLGGGRRTVQLGAPAFLGLVLQTDLDPGLAAELPAAVSAARKGDPTPLLRLGVLVASSRRTNGLNPVFAATSCDDGPFPWEPETPVSQRPLALVTAILGLPKDAFGGFGSWAATLGNAVRCLGWPLSPPRAATPSAPYPDVPVLAVTGTLDLRSPGVEARALLAHFPHGHLVTVTNAGHSALASSPSPCVAAAVRSWLNGRPVPTTCHQPLLLAPLAALPVAGASGPATPGGTLSLVAKTVDEAEATWVLAAYEQTPTTVPGLQAGALTMVDGGFVLSGYRLGPGVALSGELQADFSVSGTFRLHGVLRVKRGPATIGVLAVNGDALDGRLDGAAVVAGRVSPAAAPATLADWSTWTPPPGTTAAVTRAIASHVAAGYVLDDAGTRLVSVTAGPPAAPRDRSRRIDSLAVQQLPPGGFTVHATTGTWTYTLCGAGPLCSIAPGEPTATRGRLVRREALELALTTFEYVPDLSELVVFLPPPRGIAPTTALYFERSDLAEQLARPLAKTLALASPPLPSSPDPAEARTIDALTLDHFFRYSVAALADGTAELVLTPDF